MSEKARAVRRIRKVMPGLRSRYHVKTIGVFGSCVRGEQGKGSDLDLLVEFTAAPSLLEFIDLEQHLSRLTGRKVDLVMRRALKPRIARHILADVQYV